MGDDWMEETEEIKMVGADLHAAIDIIEHKLNCFGFEPSAGARIQSYLTNRKYTVDFD